MLGAIFPHCVDPAVGAFGVVKSRDGIRAVSFVNRDPVSLRDEPDDIVPRERITALRELHKAPRLTVNDNTASLARFRCFGKLDLLNIGYHGHLGRRLDKALKLVV